MDRNGSYRSAVACSQPDQQAAGAVLYAPLGAYRTAVACRQLYPPETDLLPLHPCPRPSSRPVLGPRSGPGLRIHRPGPLFVPADRQPAVRSCFRSADRLLASSSLDCRFSGLLSHFQPDWLHRSRKPRRCVSGLRGASLASRSMRRRLALGSVVLGGCRSWSVGDASDGLLDVLGSADTLSLRDRSRFRHPGIPFRDEKGGDSHIGGCPYPERGFRGPGQPYSDRNSNVMGGPRFRPNCKQIIGATVS
jgi:hypothetical protein